MNISEKCLVTKSIFNSRHSQKGNLPLPKVSDIYFYNPLFIGVGAAPAGQAMA